MPPQMRAFATSYSRSSARRVVAVAQAGQARDREVDLVRAEERRDHEPRCGRDARVRARVLGMVRRAREQRCPAGIADGRVVAVGVARADRRDRPPERVVVLRVEAGDEGVGIGHRDHRHEPRRVADVQLRGRGRTCGTSHAPAAPAPPPRTGRPASARCVRVVLVLEPISLTSLYSLAHFLLSSVGRAAGPELVGRVEAERPHRARGTGRSAASAPSGARRPGSAGSAACRSPAPGSRRPNAGR